MSTQNQTSSPKGISRSNADAVAEVYLAASGSAFTRRCSIQRWRSMNGWDFGSGRAGGVQKNPVHTAIGGDAQESQSRRADGRVSNVQRRARGGSEGVS